MTGLTQPWHIILITGSQTSTRPIQRLREDLASLRADIEGPHDQLAEWDFHGGRVNRYCRSDEASAGRCFRPPGQNPTRADVVAAVSVRVPLEVILMLGLGFPERPCRRHLGHDLPRPYP
jgi:hypothetical protein